jgi:nickel/cobalt transporter (NicO) family protein
LVALLGMAFFLGAAHALTPGHGKAIVAAYLAGSRGRVWDAVYLGSVVTVTHTASVFVLGLLALYASRQISLARIYPWIGLTSGALVTGAGAWLLHQRIRRMQAGPQHHNHCHHAGETTPHTHHPPHRHDEVRSGKTDLLSLGISGGLVPCPEALVVLLVSISLQKLMLGLAVLLSFSLGLASVLISIGVAVVMATPLLRRFAGEGPWMQKLPVASAAIVMILGLILVVQAGRTL